MSSIHLLLWAAAWAAAPVATDGGTPKATDPYAGRDGQTEALADIAKGRSIKVYYRSLCGEGCKFHAVAIQNCEPERFDTQNAPPGFFVSIPEASGSSGEILTKEQQSRRLSTFRFAKAYNSTMFRLRTKAILKQCPQAEASPS